MKRVLTALALIVLLVVYTVKLSAGYYACLLSVASLIAQLEFYSMYRVRGILRYTGLGFGAGVLIASYILPSLLPDILLISVIGITGLRLIHKRSPESALRELSPSLIGLLYIPMLLVPQVAIRRQGPEWIMLLYGCVWCADSFAYYIGKGLGKRKLYEEVSPNKTIAGAVGSVAGGLTGAAIVRAVLGIPLSPVAGAFIGVAIGAVSVLGDLVESMFKRDAGVKDSSSLIPGGHGGLLDKLDSVLFACPLLYWILQGFGII